MRHKITLVPGDGIGPEVTTATTNVVEAAGIDVEWETINAGAAALECDGVYLPDRLLESMVEAVYQRGEALTSDLGGDATTTEFTEAVVQHLVN